MNLWHEFLRAIGVMGPETDPVARTTPKPVLVPQLDSLVAPALPTVGQVAPASAGIPVVAVGETTSRPYIPPAATTLLHHYESCAKRLPNGLVAPYLDLGGVATIGWGNTFYADGRRVTLADRPISQAEADALFATVLARFSRDVLALLPPAVDDDAHAAFLSFAYNVGSGKDGLAGSTALKRFRSGDRSGAGAALEWWNLDNGKVMKGLQRRRRAEKLVMLGATADSAIAAAEQDYP